MHLGNTATRVCCFLISTVCFAGRMLASDEVAVHNPISAFSEPYQLIRVATPESGLIKDVAVEKGQAVKAGDVLVVLDTAVLDARYQTARVRSQAVGAIKALEAKAKLRERVFLKMQELRSNGAATPNELEKAKAEFAIAQAELESARETAAISVLESKQIRAQIERLTVRSPIDGVVIEITRDVGESVSIADPHVVTVADLERLKIVCHEYPQRIADLSVGDVVSVEFEGEDTARQGHVEYIAPVVDAESGTVRVDIVVPNHAAALRSGTLCNVHLVKDGVEGLPLQ